jgi:hypothetical protein
VPNWQTFRGAAAVAVTTMRASVGCIVNRIPEGFNRKSLTTTAEAEGSVPLVGCTGTRRKLLGQRVEGRLEPRMAGS